MPFLEVLVVGQHSRGADPLKTWHSREPVTNLSDSKLVVAVMSFDIRTGEVRDRGLVAVLLFLQHKNHFVGQPSRAVAAASEVQAQLEGHVQPVVLALVSGLTPAEIVNGVSRRLDKTEYLADAGLASVAALGGDSRSQAKPHQAEQDGPKNAIVIFV